MPSKLVRIVLDKTSNQFIVEYGERRTPGLTQPQQKEMDQLNKELIGYSDFTLAEELGSEERQQLMEKKRRLTELAEMEVREHFEWYPIEKELIESLLIVVRPGYLHVYVENLPDSLLDKILEPQITLNVSTGPPWVEDAVPTHPKEDPVDEPGALEGRTPNELAVIGVMLPNTPKWHDYVKVEEIEGIVHVTPHKFLGDDWRPINRALRAVFGQDVWKSKGQGDSGAHWECEVR